MESENKKPSNPSAFPYVDRSESQNTLMAFSDGITLRDYAQIKFMSAIISNADTMREITKSWTQAPKNNRCDFEEMIAKIGGSYADAMLKQREL